MDAAAQGAAAVRSEAEDERRSREQSLRAHHIINKLEKHVLVDLTMSDQ